VIEVRLHPGTSIVLKPRGNLEWTNAMALLRLVSAAVPSRAEVIFDLGDVDRIGAVGLSALVGSVRRVRASGGTALVTNAHLQVQRRIELVGVQERPASRARTDRLGPAA